MTIWCGMRGWTKEEQRAVYQPYILLMQLEALGAAVLGFAAFRRMSGRQFGVLVNLLLFVSGIALLGRAL